MGTPLIAIFSIMSPSPDTTKILPPCKPSRQLRELTYALNASQIKYHSGDWNLALNSEREEHMPDLDRRSSSATSQPSWTGTSDAETQTTLAQATVEGKKSKMGFCAEEKSVHSAPNSHTDVWTWELELQRETLL